MTNVVCNFHDITGISIKDAVVSLSAIYVRPTTGAVVVPYKVEQPLVDGETTFTDVVPGEATFYLRWNGGQDVTIRVTVPDEGTVTLYELMEATQEYTPAVVNRGLALIEGARDEVLSEVTTAESAAITAISDEVTRIAGDVDTRIPAGKNLFNPETDVIEGVLYLAGGGPMYNSNHRVTEKYPITPGTPVTVSGLGDAEKDNSYRFLHFWDSAGAFISMVDIPNGIPGPSYVPTDWITAVAPPGAASFSMNLASKAGKTLSPRLQIELSPRPTLYQPYFGLKYGITPAEVENALYRLSDKNLFDGKLFYNVLLNDLGISYDANESRIATSFIPVEHGKTYTISGLDKSLVTASWNRRVLGFSTSHSVSNSGFVASLPVWSGSTHTVTITDPAIRFILVQLSYDSGSRDKVEKLKIQVEEGPVATEYEPQKVFIGGNSQSPVDPQPPVDPLPVSYTDRVTVFDQLREAASGRTTTVPSRYMGPYGAPHEVVGVTDQDATGSTLYSHVEGVKPGKRSIFAHLRVRDSVDKSTTPRATVRPFTVPSGQLLYEGPTANYASVGVADDYTHPSIAYSATGVAGYKYWMVSSIFPGYSTGGVLWEDEDVFVSNDAKTWLRIKSPYETGVRPEHAPGMTLPTHDLVSSGGRKYGFLPCPARGDTLEMSMPESARGPAIDREMITVTIDGAYPWKHDPAILIDGGYVYVYHSFHLPYPDRPGGQNRFIVLTRTSDGTNWEGVRSDGSTWPVNDTTTSKMFTKDDQGRYNYLWYPAGNDSNPEIIKYANGDFEFYYGLNFGRKYAGTTPWNFDFSTPLPFQDQGAGNHPGLMYDGTALYMLSNKGLHKSTDRGATWTLMPYHPTWKGSVSGNTYKKALCVGEGGKVIVMDVSAGRMSAPTMSSIGQHSPIQQRNAMMVQEFPSVAAFTGYATSGLNDGYVDIQIDVLNYAAGTRKSHFVPYVGNTSTTILPNAAHQRVKIIDLDVAEGDEMYIYTTLMSRAGGRVSFNGFYIQ